MVYAYLFIPGYDDRGVYLDSFLDITPVHESTPESIATAKRLGIDVSKQRMLIGIVNNLFLRARFAQSGTAHKVTTEEPIDRDTLESVLAMHSKQGTLRDFLHRSKV